MKNWLKYEIRPDSYVPIILTLWWGRGFIELLPSKGENKLGETWYRKTLVLSILKILSMEETTIIDYGPILNRTTETVVLVLEL